MKFLVLVTALIPAISAAAVDGGLYPAPCGRSVPHGVCMTEDRCTSAGGFYVGRDCPFYDVSDVGCCYDIPE
ncbi:hypothetical protein QBC46DRAFT_324117 [Diplogelasinospora grovesii]|uniref:Uncharacterized protein n=1 Tax=Diplogelasinospora grovesii TaxID=303347 RepID=A0AAN6MZE1_9PEZI|nr:hypothetical protein QBC46DRAFT_324117 [Diplogelasinospora grovesii]